MREGAKTSLRGSGASAELNKVRSERFPGSWWCLGCCTKDWGRDGPLPAWERHFPRPGLTPIPRPPPPQPGRFSCSLFLSLQLHTPSRRGPAHLGPPGPQGTAQLRSQKHTPWAPRAGAGGGSRPARPISGSAELGRQQLGRLVQPELVEWLSSV